MGSCTQAGRRTSRSLISRHRALRTAAVPACWSPLAMAASMARTSLSRPGKSTPGLAGTFMALILAQAVEEAPDGWAEAGEVDQAGRSEAHTSELQSLMRISYAAICLTK